MNKLFFPFHHLIRNSAKPNSGLTLIECLVAIAVIAATSATIAPVMVLSVATRVQNQKAEQALQLAQGEIDRVRVLVESKATYTSADLKLAEPVSAAFTAFRSTAITTIGKPTSLASIATWSASTYVPSALKAREVDANGDNNPDFVIQSFRGKAIMVDTMPVAFDVGVRVYDYNAITDDAGTLVPGLGTEAAGLGFTSGEGQRGTKPLAVLYTQIINSDSARSLCEYMKYLQASVPVTMVCD